MKRALIITYYFPPSGGSGVQRWLKFTKYLPEFGWQPVIYTPSNPDFGLQDESLLKDVPASAEIIKRPIWEPYQLASFFTKTKNLNTGIYKMKDQKSLKFRMMNWVRGNMFIPDPRIFWVRPSVNFLIKYLKKNPVDVVITTGPPHSMHLIGLGLKKKLNVKWIADFRDPWSTMDGLEIFATNARSRRKHERMESEVLNRCDYVLSTSFSMPEALMPFPKEKFITITNGYDDADFEKRKPSEKADLEEVAHSKFTFFHAGVLNALREPKVVWEVLAEKSQEDAAFQKHLQIHLVGNVDGGIQEALSNHPVLKYNVQLEGYVSHDQVVEYYERASVLLLLVNNSSIAQYCIPGKVFEYLATRKAILGLGKIESDAIQILKKTKSGMVSEYDDKVAIRNAVDFFYEQFLEKKSPEFQEELVSAYSRRNLAKRLGVFLDEMK